MTISVTRMRQGKESTLSHILIDGTFFCYGLEDQIREEKIPGSTAIPAGRYRLGLNTYGAMNARYKRRFPELHRGMVEILKIPNFSYVYIHTGNNIGHTAGCLLVGDSYGQDKEGDYEIYQSEKAYKRLYRLIIAAMEKGNEVWILISNEVKRDE